MDFVLHKNSDDYIPPNCTSIRLTDASKLSFLCTFLQHNTTVKEVDLCRNQIEEEGVKAIAEVLKVNCTVTKLDLGNNLIGNEGAKAIAKALKVNRTITELNLFLGQIGVEGAKAIAKVLKVNSTIKELNLYLNEIGDEGAKAIAKALKVNCTVTKLSLWGNQISVGGERAIVEALEVNNVIYYKLKQVVADAKCKTIALGLFQTVPIYVLLDIHELVIILDLEHKTNSHKFYNNNSFSKLLEQNVSKKRLLNIMDKITRAIHLK